MRHPRIQPIALAIALLSAAGSASAATSLPALSLAEAGASGQRAIDLLGAQLPAVAAAYRKTPEQLRKLLLEDRTYRLDRQGRLYVVDTLERPLPPAPEGKASAEATGQSLVPLSDTFTLHSRPGANRTIYLDFNGAVLQNTAWNDTIGSPTINALPFDSDGNTGALSDAELERIQYIWQRVAEDYAPFDVDVTTEEPSPDRLTRSDLSDQVFGTTALITNHNGVYNCSCGGVAYIGVFDYYPGDYYKPALVFWDMLGAGNEKYVAEAISHEVGHNLGLNHDGYSGGGYYPGHGSGATGWAPIMGVGYYQPVVQWSQGEYATANNTEDDFAVIQANGAALRADDHRNRPGPGATALTATPSGARTALAGAGVIETRKDRDVFSFQAGAGVTTIVVNPDARAPNLDVRLRILDAAGTPVKSASPDAKLSSKVRVTLPAGTYYVMVDGVGFGDPLVNGYTDYGSVGQYTISGTTPTP